MKILGIFPDLNSTISSSIVAQSFINNLSTNISIKYYTFSEKFKYHINNIINQWKKIFV